MKINLTKHYETKNGKSVKILCVDRRHERFPVVALVNFDEYEITNSYTLDGIDSNEEYELNLVNVKEKHEVWINIYPFQMPMSHPSREAADVNALRNRTARIKITYKNGQFDE